MAFPATYNFSYYRGDTYQINLSPKDASGADFDLSGYSSTFTVANKRGEEGLQVECYSEINGNTLTCVITPENSQDIFFPTGTQAVYDVQISKEDIPYDFVYTLLTGTITFTDDITGAVAEESGESS